MRQQHRQPTAQRALLALPHALKLLGDVFRIDLGQTPSTDQFGIAHRPGVKVLMIDLAGSTHGLSLLYRLNE
jgi:hypothetical protein